MSKVSKAVPFVAIAALVSVGAIFFPNTELFGVSSSLSAGAQAQQVQRPASIGAMGELVFRIQQVEFGSPAEQAGLQLGDLILLLNGGQIESINQVWNTIHGSADKPVEVTFLRYNSVSAKFEENKATVKPVTWGTWRK